MYSTARSLVARPLRTERGANRKALGGLWEVPTYNWRAISDIAYRAELAHVHAPKDVLTKIAVVSVKVATTALTILLPLQIVTTGLGGCLIALTFGIAFFVLDLIWWPFLVLLLGTSWLWLHAWYLRPILLVPGVLISILGHLYVMLTPDPERDAKYAKLSITNEWPLSWYLMKPPPEYYEWAESEALEG